MKRFLLTVVLVCCFLIPLKLNAATYTFGASTWLSWWEPVFTKRSVNPPVFNETVIVYQQFGSSLDMKPAVIIGPVFAVKFNNNVSLSASGTFGHFDGSSTVRYNQKYGTVNNRIVVLESSYSIDKYDVDMLCNYQILPWLKIFTGIKYQGYNFKQRACDQAYLSTELITTSDSTAVGPGAGVTGTMQVIGSLYAIGSLSGSYLISSINQQMEATGIWSILPIIKSHENFNIFGGNASLTFAYYLSNINTTLSLGGRYQKLYYLLASGHDDYGYNGQSDTFYGLTLSATYTF